MIARHEATAERIDIWAQLAAPLPTGTIAWRQDGRPIQRDGQFFARFVAYVDANTVRERLDGVVPGEWDLTLELMPTLATDDTDGTNCSFKARLQILGVIREDVGNGRDYKQAATDAFKRAAVRFGIAHELYAYEQNWVQVDGDGKYARPLEDPAEAYARRTSRKGERTRAFDDAPTSSENGDAVDRVVRPIASDEPTCPKCGGRVWDNRISKRNPKAPDFKCRSRSCDGVIWPQRVSADTPT
ncbi:MAG TPA: Rad52/Rad22 family DNA repair protein, partial [Gemmatimonadaceae bacterium]